LFLGHHFTQLKNLNRVPIRSEWQKLITNGVYLTQGFDQNILILTPNTFQDISIQISALNIADPIARMFMRMFFSTASYVENIENETISLPQNLLDYANLEADIAIVGQGEYVEVWSSDLWLEQQSEIQNSEANAQRFSAFTITLTEKTRYS